MMDVTGAGPAVPRRRADLHVHTCHSGINHNLAFLHSLDCYSRPVDVYRVAKARGMDYVAFTDHDSIGGALEFLDAHPDATDVIVGEEISCRFPDAPVEVHFGAYGMTEALHRDVQPLRRNVHDVAAFLLGHGVFFALNHLFHFYRGQMPLDAYLRLLESVPALETRNGAMLPAHNTLIARLRADAARARARPLAVVAGSDAHTLRRVGTTWTTAPGESAAAFMAHVAAGRGVAEGAHGGALAIAGDIYGVMRGYAKGLLGLGPAAPSGGRRVAGVAFTLGTLPFQFVPLVVAIVNKQQERVRLAALARTDKEVLQELSTLVADE